MAVFYVMLWARIARFMVRQSGDCLGTAMLAAEPKFFTHAPICAAYSYDKGTHSTRSMEDGTGVHAYAYATHAHTCLTRAPAAVGVLSCSHGFRMRWRGPALGGPGRFYSTRIPGRCRWLRGTLVCVTTIRQQAEGTLLGQGKPARPDFLCG